MAKFKVQWMRRQKPRDEQQQHVDSDKQLGKSVEGFCIRVQLQAKGARINLHLHLQSSRFVFGQ